MRKFAVFIPVLALLMLLASSSSAIAQQTISVTIGPGRDEASGTGTATLTAMGAQTRVVLSVAPTNPEMLADILGQGHSINLHRSPADSGIYVGCGNLAGAFAGAGGAGAAQVPQPRALPATGDVASLAGLFAAAGAALVGAGFGVLRWRRG